MEAGRLVKITYLGLQPWVSLRIPCGECFFVARGLTQRNTDRLEGEAKKTGGEELSWVSTKGQSLQR